jgi:TRAP-type C4-dicarboxylate transport system permease small subunit
MQIGAVLLFVLMVLGVADVIGRYVFNRPIIGSSEISQIIVGTIVFLSLGFTHLKKGHVIVDFFLVRFSSQSKTMASITTISLSLALFSLIAWQALLAAKQYHGAGRLVDIVHIPLAPFLLIVSLGSLVICFVLIMELVQCILHIRKEK